MDITVRVALGLGPGCSPFDAILLQLGGGCYARFLPAHGGSPWHGWCRGWQLPAVPLSWLVLQCLRCNLANSELSAGSWSSFLNRENIVHILKVYEATQEQERTADEITLMCTNR